MSDQTSLQVQPQTAVVEVEQRTGGGILAVIERASRDPSVNVENMERLYALLEKEKARQAEGAFTDAFVRLQADLPTIVAKTAIQNRGKYERFEDCMEVVGPLLRKHGFTASFAEEKGAGTVTQTLILKRGGHTERFPFTVRVGNKADNDTQADCKASTTAKRKALENGLNLVIRQDALNDEDAGDIGDGSKITAEQSMELERRAKDTGSNIKALLDFAGAKTFEDIPAAKYDTLDALLKRKEARR